jgi:hypothetical protein
MCTTICKKALQQNELQLVRRPKKLPKGGQTRGHFPEEENIKIALPFMGQIRVLAFSFCQNTHE